MKTRRSQSLFKSAQKLFVGGVNSPIRSFQAVEGTPRFIRRGKGALVWDEDGNRLIDYVLSWGPMILGHADRAVLSAAGRALKNGIHFGAPSEAELELGTLIQSAFSSIEKLRFVNSGTEAAMSAIRVARGATRRAVIVKFEGCYHGHADSLLVKAGSGALTFGTPTSAGVVGDLIRHTRVLNFNDTEGVERFFKQQGNAVAAVIVEPVPAHMGLVIPNLDFLQALRRLTAECGAVLIFDEGMTGFRVAWGGAQTLYKIDPDLTCFGRIIGAGFPAAAYGGKKWLMDWIAPEGPVYESGTLSANPVVMTAGLAALRRLKALNPYAALEKRTAALAEGLRKEASQAGISVQSNHLGSMFSLFFAAHPVTTASAAFAADRKRYSAFFHGMLERGIYLPPSQFESAFVSVAHSGALIDKTLAAARKVFPALHNPVLSTGEKRHG